METSTCHSDRPDSRRHMVRVSPWRSLDYFLEGQRNMTRHYLIFPLFVVYIATLPIQILVLALYVHPIVAVFIYPGAVAFVRIRFEWSEFKARFRQLAREEPPAFRAWLRLYFKRLFRR